MSYFLSLKTEKVESIGKESTYRVWRRYNQFLELRKYLEAIHPSCIIPPMPAKRTGDLWNKITQDTFSADFITTRQMGLERFLKRVKAQPKLASDKIVYEFLTNDSGWNEVVEATDYQKKSGMVAISIFFNFLRLNIINSI